MAHADALRDEVEQLRDTLRREVTALRLRGERLDRDILRLEEKNLLLDRQLQALRAAGPGRPAAAGDGGDPPRIRRAARSAPAPALVAQADAAAPARAAPNDQSAPITGPAQEQQQARRTLETALPLSTTGGVLTPKGQIQVSPTFGFDYTAQNQLGVNGFQIIPGITFGNIFVNRVEQSVLTGGVTVRVGVTDRLELNARIPYVFNSTSTTSLIPLGANAQQLSTSGDNSSIGDIQLGASYQFNAGQDGWPIFIGNATFKTTTGTSPYEVPIFTTNDPNGQFLRGIPKRGPTGTGFYSVSPSLTVIYPTAPGTLFANLQYTNNLGQRVSIKSFDGGPSTPVDLTPGEALALTFGIGFALNEKASLSLSYQQQHVFSSQQGGRNIPGSSYSFGSFNFGVGYELSERTRVNANIGIGVGPNTPAARLLIEVPYRFSL